MTEQYHPERYATVTPKYSPAGHRGRLDQLYRAKAPFKAILAEREAADAFLRQLAAPLLTEPPEEQRYSIDLYIGTSWQETQRIPFTKSEVRAIINASIANNILSFEGGYGSGAEREYGNGISDPRGNHQSFPLIFEGNLFEGLRQRAPVIWVLMLAARSAENALDRYMGTAMEPLRRASIESLETMRDLPDRLIRHQPPRTRQKVPTKLLSPC